MSISSFRVLRRILPLAAGAVVLGVSAFFAFSQAPAVSADDYLCEAENLAESGAWLSVDAALQAASSAGISLNTYITAHSGALSTMNAKMTAFESAIGNSSAMSSAYAEMNTAYVAVEIAAKNLTGSLAASALATSGVVLAMRDYDPFLLDIHTCESSEETLTASGSLEEIEEPEYISVNTGTSCQDLWRALWDTTENMVRAENYLKEIWAALPQVEALIKEYQRQLRVLDQQRPNAPGPIMDYWIEQRNSLRANILGLEHMYVSLKRMETQAKADLSFWQHQYNLKMAAWKSSLQGMCPVDPYYGNA